MNCSCLYEFMESKRLKDLDLSGDRATNNSITDSWLSFCHKATAELVCVCVRAWVFGWLNDMTSTPTFVFLPRYTAVTKNTDTRQRRRNKQQDAIVLFCTILSSSLFPFLFSPRSLSASDPILSLVSLFTVILRHFLVHHRRFRPSPDFGTRRFHRFHYWR